jgi:transposase
MAIGPTGVLAPLAIEGATDGTIFVRWLNEWLLPLLPAGTTIVCDNLSVHRHEDVRLAIEAANCVLRYLPPSSPDVNPIEQVSSMLKARLRAAAGRTFETLVAAIREALDATTAEQLANCYRHCGYRLRKPPAQAL